MALIRQKSPTISQQQKGVAIISVLFVVVLVTLLATRMSRHLQEQIARVGASEYAEQAYWHWLSAEALVRQVLLQEHKESDGRTHLQQGWATQQGPFPVRGGSIAGQVIDLHACFNLNSLATSANNTANLAVAIERYEHLLTALDFDEYSRRRLVASLVDWLDEDTVLYDALGAEDSDYGSLAEPYLAANSLLVHVSELRQLIGYSQEVYQRLQPYVCVIPTVQEWTLNLNTVAEDKPELVQAFFRGALDRSSAEKLLRDRPERGFESLDAIKAEPVLQKIARPGFNDDLAGLTINSQYFELNAQITYGGLEFYGTSQFKLAEQKSWVLYRSRGEYEESERKNNN